jgi:hypothetical protein
MDVFNNLLVSNGAKANLVVPLFLAVSVMGVAFLDALEGGRPLDLIDAGYIGFNLLKPGDVICGFQVSAENKIQDRFFLDVRPLKFSLPVENVHISLITRW